MRSGLLVFLISVGLLLKGDDSLVISGYHTMYFRSYKVSGDSSLYNYDNYGNDSSFDDYTNLYIRGKLYKNAFIDAQFSRDRFSPMGNKITLEYRGKGVNIKVGSILASLMGNEFATLSKSLDGILFSVSLKANTTLSIVASQAKGSTKVESFRGNNSPGPYYLRFSPIVEGSEVVKVDDAIMRRGIDYDIDYYTGELNFLGARIIPEGSIITVSYEYFYSQGNSIYGFRLGQEGKWGITYLGRPQFSYIPPQEHSREEYFIGTGTPGPFYLSNRPLVENSETVIIDGVTQPKESYQINYLSGIITFNRPIPQGASVVVRYKYRSDVTSLGSKEVVGVDGKVNLGGLPLVLQAARSTDGVNSGTAFGVQTSKNFKGKAGEFSFTYNLRSISDKFAPLESVGFFRQEKGQIFSLNWANIQHTIRASLNLSTGKRPYGYSFSPISPSQLSSYNDTSFNLDLALPHLPNIVLSHYSTSQGGGYNYENVRDELRIFSSKSFRTKSSETSVTPPFTEEGKPSTQMEEISPPSIPSSSIPSYTGYGGYSTSSTFGSSYYGGSYYGAYFPSYGGYSPYGGFYRGRGMGQIGLFTPGISWSLSLSRQKSRGGYETNYNSDFLMSRFNLVYIPTEKLKFSADIGKNKSSISNSSTSLLQFSYNPSEKISFVFSLDNSSSGSLSQTSSYINPVSPGYYYGGFSGGINQRRRSLDIQYLPSARLTLSLSLENSFSEGNYSSNSASNSKSLFFTYLLSPRASLNGTYMLQDMDFVGTSGGMKSKLGYLTLSYQPFKNLPYFILNLDYQFMNTSNLYSSGTSASTAESKLEVWALRMQNPIGKDKSIFGEIRKTDSSGNYGYSRLEGTLGMEFRLKQYLTWSLSLNKINYNGEGSSSRGYSATLLNSILSLRF
ncbi:MAG: hypothetical protein ACPLSK_00265 [bacterium]